MANNLSTLNPKLATKLRDAGYAVWATGEIDDLLTWATARLYPRLSRPVQELASLTNDADQVVLTTVQDISRIDLLDADSKLVLQLMGGTWEWWGDHESLGGTLYINPQFSSSTYQLRVHGYAPYTLSNSIATQNPPDRYVQLILATAAAEALRRMLNDRAKFKAWGGLNQEQNVSVNELIGMVNEADNEARMLTADVRTWRRPKPASR